MTCSDDWNEYYMIQPSISDRIHFKIIQNIQFGIQRLIYDAETDMQNKNPDIRNVKINRIWTGNGDGDGYETFIVYNNKGFVCEAVESCSSVPLSILHHCAMINIRSEAHTLCYDALISRLHWSFNFGFVYGDGDGVCNIKFTMLNMPRMFQCFDLLMHRMQNAGRYFTRNFNWKIQILCIKTVSKHCSHVIRYLINVILFFCRSLQRISSIRFHFFAFFSFPRQYNQQKYYTQFYHFFEFGVWSAGRMFAFNPGMMTDGDEKWKQKNPYVYECQCNRMNERWAHLVNDKIPYWNDFWGFISLTSHQSRMKICLSLWIHVGYFVLLRYFFNRIPFAPISVFFFRLYVRHLKLHHRTIYFENWTMLRFITKIFII